MELVFHPLTLADKQLVLKYTWYADLMNCDLAFANLIAWQFLYHTEVAEWKNFLLFRFYADGHLAYLMPIGAGDWKEVLDLLRKDACQQRRPVLILGVTERIKDYIEKVCPGRFAVNENRAYADYIYKRESLATLAGKKLQAKRNHINKFRKLYPEYEYRELTEDLFPLCLNLYRQWEEGKEEQGESRAVQAEKTAIMHALNHFRELELIGGALFVDGEMIAFTYGAAINDSTFDVCVEKADTRYEGVYAVINNEFVKHLPEHFRYINREEDLGLEGLRKAKMSYMPHEVLMKYSLWSACSLPSHSKEADEAALQVKWHTRALWKLCFGDDDAFLDLFFGSKYTLSNNTFVCHEGRVVSALQRLPYEMSYQKECLPVAYIAGASTLPECRGEGLMSGLLREAHQTMYDEGKVFSVLIPAEDSLVAFYEKAGYTLCAPLAEKAFQEESLSDGENLEMVWYDRFVGDFQDTVCAFMEEIYKSFPAAVLHDDKDLNVVWEDHCQSGGRLLVACRQSDRKMLGVAWPLPEQQTVRVKEILAVSASVRKGLLDEVGRTYPDKPVYESAKKVQIKVIRVQDALAAYARCSGVKSRYVQVTGDDLRPDSSIVYHLSETGCAIVSGEVEPDIKISAEELPSVLFPQGGPYLRLMLD